MKRIMILGASAGQMPMIRKVKELGYELAVIDYNDRAVGIPYADKFYRASTIDAAAVVRAAKDYKPDGITTVQTDMPMRAVAEACRELHLPGISPQAAMNATDKEKMMEAFKRAGVSSPWFCAFAPRGYGCIHSGKDTVSVCREAGGQFREQRGYRLLRTVKTLRGDCVCAQPLPERKDHRRGIYDGA